MSRLRRWWALTLHLVEHHRAVRSMMRGDGWGPVCRRCEKPRAQFMAPAARAATNALVDIEGVDRSEFWASGAFCHCEGGGI